MCALPNICYQTFAISHSLPGKTTCPSSDLFFLKRGALSLRSTPGVVYHCGNDLLSCAGCFPRLTLFTAKGKSQSPRIASESHMRVLHLATRAAVCTRTVSGCERATWLAVCTRSMNENASPTPTCAVTLQTCSRLLGPEAVNGRSGAKKSTAKTDSNGGGGTAGGGKDGGGAGSEGGNGGGGQRGNNGKFTFWLGLCGNRIPRYCRTHVSFWSYAANACRAVPGPRFFAIRCWCFGTVGKIFTAES